MKLPVEESSFIECDVRDIVRYLGRRDPALPARFIEAFKSTVILLAEMPHLGQPRPDLETPEVRSWRVGSFRRYLLFYEALPNKLRLLRVLHGYRDLQAELEK